MENVDSTAEAIAALTTLHTSDAYGSVASSNFGSSAPMAIDQRTTTYWSGPRTNQCYYPSSGSDPYTNSANVYPYVRVDFDMPRAIDSMTVDFYSQSYNAYYFYLEYCPYSSTCANVHAGGWLPIDPTNGGTNEVGYRNTKDLTKVTLKRSSPAYANAVRIRIECSGEPKDRYPVIRELSASGPAVWHSKAGGPYAAYRTEKCPVGTPSYGNPDCKRAAISHAQITTYMNNAAKNWGCNTAHSSGPHGTTSSNGDVGLYRWYYGFSGQLDCVVYWNPQAQAAYTMIATAYQANPNQTTPRLFWQYQDLGFEKSYLGFPTSNPYTSIHGDGPPQRQDFVGGVLSAY